MDEITNQPGTPHRRRRPLGARIGAAALAAFAVTFILGCGGDDQRTDRTSEDHTVTTGAPDKTPDELPDDFPLPAGAEFKSAADGNYEYVVPMTPEALADHFEDNLPDWFALESTSTKLAGMYEGGSIFAARVDGEDRSLMQVDLE